MPIALNQIAVNYALVLKKIGALKFRCGSFIYFKFCLGYNIRMQFKQPTVGGLLFKYGWLNRIEQM